MINVILYNNSSDKQVLDKNITQIATLQCEIKSEISVLHPVLILNYDSVINFNYVYISQYNRYYYVDDIVLSKGNTKIVYCSVDVIMSYKNDILGLNCVINRNENNYNKYIIDTNIPVENQPFFDEHEIPGKIFTTGNFAYLLGTT